MSQLRARVDWERVGFNRIVNEGFETDTSGWSIAGNFLHNAASSLTRITTDRYHGLACAELVCPGTSLSGCSNLISGTFLSGVTYRLLVALKHVSGTTAAQITLGFADGVTSDAAGLQVTLTAGWVVHTIDWTPTANRTGVQAVVSKVIADPTALTCRIDYAEAFPAHNDVGPYLERASWNLAGSADLMGGSAVGSATLVLLNDDGRFRRGSTNPPVDVGVPIRITAQVDEGVAAGDGSAERGIFYGRVTDLAAVVEYPDRVQLNCEGELATYGRADSVVLFSNTRSYRAYREEILTDLGVPAAARILTAESEMLPFSGMARSSALSELEALNVATGTRHHIRPTADQLGYRYVTIGRNDNVEGTIASDDFSDAQTDTWLNADTGGAWTLSGTAADFDKAAGVGTVNVGTAPLTRAAALLTVDNRDVDVVFKVKTDKVPTGANMLIYATVRQDSILNDLYRTSVTITNTTGAVTLGLSKVVAGTPTTITGGGAVARETWVAGTWFWIRLGVTGDGTTTTLRSKVWRDGTTEPVAWDATGTDTEAGLQDSGGVGVRMATATGVTNVPILVTFDDFAVQPASIVAIDDAIASRLDGYSTAVETVRNRQRVVASPLVLDVAQTVWTYQDLPWRVKAGVTRVRWARFGKQVRDAALVHTKTGTGSVTAIFYGTEAKITVAATTDLEISALSVTGRPASQTDEIAVVEEDAASRILYQRRSGPDVSTALMSSDALAEGLAKHHVWRFREPHPRPTLLMIDRWHRQTSSGLYDVISLTWPRESLVSRRFEIVGVVGRYARQDGAWALETDWRLQELPYSTTDQKQRFRLGLSKLGGTHVLAK